MVNSCLDTSSTSLNMYVKTGTKTAGWVKELWFVLIYIKWAPKQKQHLDFKLEETIMLILAFYSSAWN